MLKLYEHPVSSYAQKVKIAQREKGLPFGAEVPEGLGSGRRDGPSVAATFAEFDASVERRGDAAALYAKELRQREYRDHCLEWLVKSGGIEVVLAGLRNRNICFPRSDVP